MAVVPCRHMHPVVSAKNTKVFKNFTTITQFFIKILVIIYFKALSVCLIMPEVSMDAQMDPKAKHNHATRCRNISDLHFICTSGLPRDV